MNKLVLFIVVILSLASCTNPEEKAKELGFLSVQQMSELTAKGFENYDMYKAEASRLGFDSVQKMEDFKRRGYESYSDFESVKKFKSSTFYTQCIKAKSAADYNSNCKGKRVYWSGIVKSINGSDIVVSVLSNNAPLTKGLFSVGSSVELFSVEMRAQDSRIENGDVGKIILFEGVVSNQNIATPDVNLSNIVSIESDQDRDTRFDIINFEKNRMEEERKKKEAEDIKLKEIAELNAHLNDADWLQEKFSMAGSTFCESGADEYLRKVVNYDFKWDELGWFDVKFNLYSRSVKSPGVIILISDKLALQNGFGGYKRKELECYFDVRENIVVGFGIK